MGRSHRDRIKESIAKYNEENPDDAISIPAEGKNFITSAWDKLGKTGQVITLVVTILTGLTALKPYVVGTYEFFRSFVYAVDNVESNTKRIEELEKYGEVTSAILKSVLYPLEHINPDGTKIKLYRTREVDGKYMAYHFVDCCIFYAANYEVDSGQWYYIDGDGVYHKIDK